MAALFDVQVDGDDAIDQAMQAMARGMQELGTRAAVAGAQVVRSHAVKDTIRRRGEYLGKTKSGKDKYAALGPPIEGVLTSRTGALRSSIRVVPLAAEEAALVGPSVKYGRIHEFGGTLNVPAHTRKAHTRKIGALFSGRKKIATNIAFVKAHAVKGYTVQMPARPYLAPAYSRYVGEVRERISRVLAQGVSQAIQKAGRMVVRFR